LQVGLIKMGLVYLQVVKTKIISIILPARSFFDLVGIILRPFNW